MRTPTAISVKKEAGPTIRLAGPSSRQLNPPRKLTQEQ